MKNYYEFWLKNAPDNVIKEIEKYSQKQIEDAFAKEMKFGTAGIRGPIKWGTNFINLYTISKATYGFGKLILEKYGDRAKKYGVVIAHDNRRMRIEFTLTTAKILSNMGIKVNLFHNNDSNPTPLLSFTIANNDFVGGINITASHNPPTDNGFKVYGEDGIQLPEEDTNKIQKYSEGINYFKIEQDEKNIHYLNDSFRKVYLDKIMELIPFDKNIDRHNLKITYSAQHGTGTYFATELAKRMNVTLYLAPNQCKEDENFTYTISPNPQSLLSYIESIETANKNGSELIFVTDPDADRFGILVLQNNKWVHINGDELPVIQIFYKLSRLKEINAIGPNDFIIRSVVTSRMADLVAKDFNVKVLENLTGFKWLISKALKYEKETHGQCIFAWEESYGSTVRTFTRDKDSFQALVQVIELADYYRKQGKTLVDVLDMLNKKYGKHETFQIQKRFEGVNGISEMLKLLIPYRNGEIKSIGKYKIKNLIDYKNGHKDIAPQDFIILELEGGSWISLRPSGTEPILRVYFELVGIEREYIEQYFR